MLKLIADHDIEGHLDVLLRIWTSPSRRETWAWVDCRTFTLRRLGWAENLPDFEVWRLCQQSGMVLLTGNRNEESEESLEATLKKHNTLECLPVFTIGDPKKFMLDAIYAGKVADKLLDYLSELDRLMGAGRLYVP